MPRSSLAPPSEPSHLRRSHPGRDVRVGALLLFGLGFGILAHAMTGAVSTVDAASLSVYRETYYEGGCSGSATGTLVKFGHPAACAPHYASNDGTNVEPWDGTYYTVDCVAGTKNLYSTSDCSDTPTTVSFSTCAAVGSTSHGVAGECATVDSSTLALVNMYRAMCPPFTNQIVPFELGQCTWSVPTTLGTDDTSNYGGGFKLTDAGLDSYTLDEYEARDCSGSARNTLTISAATVCEMLGTLNLGFVGFATPGPSVVPEWTAPPSPSPGPGPGPGPAPAPTSPSRAPSKSPSRAPSKSPSRTPSRSPTKVTSKPTTFPTAQTKSPTTAKPTTFRPTVAPTVKPTTATAAPTAEFKWDPALNITVLARHLGHVKFRRQVKDASTWTTTDLESFTCEFVADGTWHTLTETKSVRVELLTKSLNPDIPELAVVERVRITDIATGSKAEFSAGRYGDLVDTSVSSSIGSGSIAYTGWVRGSDAKDNYGGGTEDFMDDISLVPTRIMRWTADRDVIEDVTIYARTDHLDAWNRLQGRTDTASLADRALGPRPGLRPLGASELSVRVRILVNRPVVDSTQAAWRSSGRRGMLLPQRPCPGNRKTPHVFFPTRSPTGTVATRVPTAVNATTSPTSENSTAPTATPSAAPSRSPTTARRTPGTIEMDRLYAMARDPAISDTYLGPSHPLVYYGEGSSGWGLFTRQPGTGYAIPAQTYWLGCRATKVSISTLNPTYTRDNNQRKWTSVELTVADADLVACRIDTFAVRYFIAATRGGAKPLGEDFGTRNISTANYLWVTWSLTNDAAREPGAFPERAPRAPQVAAFAWAFQEDMMWTTNAGGRAGAGALSGIVALVVGVAVVVAW